MYFVYIKIQGFIPVVELLKLLW